MQIRGADRTENPTAPEHDISRRRWSSCPISAAKTYVTV